MCADDPCTFVWNGRYHFDEEVEMNLLGPISGGGSCWRTAEQPQEVVTSARAITTANGGVWPGPKLGPASSAPSDPAPPTHALR